MLSKAAPDCDEDERLQPLSPSLREWLRLERFHLHDPHLYQRTERDPGFNVSYLPQNCGVFQLPCYRVPRRHLYSIGTQQKRGELQLLNGDAALLPMHPSAVHQYRDFLERTGARDVAIDGPRIWAVPTSSTRTVLAWPEDAPAQAVFLKTSLHSPVFGDRRITRIRAGRSVSLSALFEAERDELPALLSCLPEPLALTPRREPEMGAIVRSIPSDIKEGKVRVAPLFALIGGQGGHVPLLLTILERTNANPLELVREALCAPFAKLWLELALNHGLLIEAHGQDLLLELSGDLIPSGRFYYRDFEGLQVDWELRRRLGKPAPAHLAGQWCWREAYGTLGNHRYADLLWFKWRISLIQYLHFVLHQTEAALRAWRRDGHIGGAAIEQDEITMLFSRCLFDVLRRMFGPMFGGPGSAPYNVYYSLNSFLILLAKLRQVRLRDAGASAAPRKAPAYNADLTFA